MEGLGYTMDIMGGGGTAPVGEGELEDRLEVVTDKVRKDTREIVDLLRADFPHFFRRQVKERFVTDAGFADTLTDAQVKTLKADVEAAGRRAVDELIPALENGEMWLTPAVPASEGRRDLAGNAAVHERIQRIGGMLRELLAKHGFPELKEEDFRDAYRLPSWFIGGKLLVSLVESYWRNLEEWKALKDALRTLREKATRTKRSERWDAV